MVQHCVHVNSRLNGRIWKKACCLTWILLSPGQNPGTKDPPHLSEVFMQIPELDPVLHVFLMQHCTSVGPGQ